jgi:hypothetical protein
MRWWDVDSIFLQTTLSFVQATKGKGHFWNPCGERGRELWNAVPGTV